MSKRVPVRFYNRSLASVPLIPVENTKLGGLRDTIRTMFGIFNPYEIRARILPAVMLVFPVPFAVLSLAFGSQNAGAVAAWTSAVSIAFLFVVSVYIRTRGFNKEKKLWASWDGPPSTRYLRWSDPTFPKETKGLISEKCQRLFGVPLPSEQLEKENGKTYDEEIFKVFRMIRGALFMWNKDGLWEIQNAYYGYARNLYGCRWEWSGIALVAFLASLIKPIFFNSQWNWTIVITTIYLVLVVPYAFWVLPSTAESFANRYAENAIMSFLLVGPGNVESGEE
ncbi:MAG: hypothetical protein PHP64_05055 [Actinomycetota bacterium]|nr:hypothetical protein [Actinomycetota bacterium]